MSQDVLVIQRRMTGYRLPLFNRLRELLAPDGIVLSVVQGTPSAAERRRGDSATLEWATPCKCTYLNLGRSQPFIQRLPRRLRESQNLVILPHENWMVANSLGLAFRRPPTQLLGFWGHGANFQDPDGHGLRQRVKASTAHMADWWFAYTVLSVEHLRSIGFPRERITCLNNAVDTWQLSRWREEINDEEREVARRRLGLQGRVTGVFIGSLHVHKRLNFLLDTADRLRDRTDDFELIIIGDGPLKPRLLAQASSRPWLKVVGHLQGRAKALHASLGHVILNPGMVGLGILDSFALGIPLMTTDCRIHSPEIAYLRPGANGLITRNELDAYVSEVASLLGDPERLHLLAEGCREDAGRYNIDEMAANFADGIRGALDAGRAIAHMHRT